MQNIQIKYNNKITETIQKITKKNTEKCKKKHEKINKSS